MDVKENTLIAAEVILALGRLHVLRVVVEDDVAVGEDIVCPRVVLDVIGPQPHIQIAHVYVAICDVAVALFPLLSSLKANNTPSYRHLDLRAKR